MICGIVAIEQGQGIGFQNQMPWPRLTEDLRWFKENTVNNVIVMGSNTWKSIGRPLPDRINVVISSQLQKKANLTYSDPIEAINDLKERCKNKLIFIIGGQQLFEATKHIIEKFYVTEIHANYTCDKFFDLKFVEENFPNIQTIINIDKTESTPSYIIREYSK